MMVYIIFISLSSVIAVFIYVKLWNAENSWWVAKIFIESECKITDLLQIHLQFKKSTIERIRKIPN